MKPLDNPPVRALFRATLTNSRRLEREFTAILVAAGDSTSGWYDVDLFDALVAGSAALRQAARRLATPPGGGWDLHGWKRSAADARRTRQLERRAS